MRDKIRAIDLVNRIRLKRGQMSKHCFVIVEGEDDSKFYGRFADASTRIELAHGKPRALEAISVLSADLFSGVVALVDADHDWLDGRGDVVNVVVTDFHDLECLLVASSALSLVLREFGIEELIAQFETAKQRTLREHLVAVGEAIGLLRLASSRRVWQLKFDGLSFERFVREKDVELNYDALLEEVRRHQGGRAEAPPTIDVMRDAVETLRSEKHDPWQVCCGHDLVEVLAIGLRRAWGKRNRAEVQPARLESMLRLAYEEVHFANTRMHACMRSWEEQNQPFRLLRQGLVNVTVQPRG